MFLKKQRFWKRERKGAKTFRCAATVSGQSWMNSIKLAEENGKASLLKESPEFSGSVQL